MQAVRLYGSGIATSGITRLIPASDRRIREWAHQYEQDGLEGLKSQGQGENALKLSREQGTDLRQRMQQYRPDLVIVADVRLSRGAFWTVSDVQMVVNAWYPLEYRRLDSYRSLLPECGLSYQRTEKVYRSQPDAQTVADFAAALEKKGLIFGKLILME